MDMMLFLLCIIRLVAVDLTWGADTMSVKQNTTSGSSLQCFISTIGWHQQGHAAWKNQWVPRNPDSSWINTIAVQWRCFGNYLVVPCRWWLSQCSWYTALIINPFSLHQSHWLSHLRALHSANTDSLLMPSVRLSSVGSRAFPVAAPCTWDDLSFAEILSGHHCDTQDDLAIALSL